MLRNSYGMLKTFFGQVVQIDNADTLDQTKHDLEELSWCTAGMTSNGSAAAENLLGLISAAKKRVISLPSSNDEARGNYKMATSIRYFKNFPSRTLQPQTRKDRDPQVNKSFS